jgi:hypothetical protein
MQININDEKGLLRDTNSKAILSSDRAGLLRYKQDQIDKKRLSALEHSVTTINSDIKEIKELLNILISSKNRGI